MRFEVQRGCKRGRWAVGLVGLVALFLLACGGEEPGKPAPAPSPALVVLTPTTTSRVEPAVTPTATGESQDYLLLVGYWQGAILVFGRALGLAMDFQASEEGLTGTIDLPQEGMVGKKMSSVTFFDDFAIRVEADLGFDAGFDGNVRVAGAQIGGIDGHVHLDGFILDDGTVTDLTAPFFLNPVEASPTPTPSASAGLTVDLRDGGGPGPFSFLPADFSFSVGDTVDFTFISETQFHTFTVDDLGIDVSVNEGARVNFEYTFDKPGTYELICIPHQALGMVGTIAVQ